MCNLNVIHRSYFTTLSESVLLLLYSLAFVILFSYAADAKENTGILLTSISPGSSIQFIQNVENEEFSLKEATTFKIRAFIEPITQSQKIIFKQKGFSFKEQRFECRDFPCSKTWDFDLADKNLSIKDFPYLQLDWSQSFLGSIPEISVQVEFMTEESKQRTIHFNGFFGEKKEQLSSPIKTIDMKTVEYSEKFRRLYVIKREIGIKADSKWYYTRDGDNLVLQSRIDQPLSSFQTVQVISDQNWVPERVQFSVDTTGNGRRDLFVLFEQISHSLEKKNGQSILTFDLQGAIKQLGVDPQKAVLLEPIIFLPIKTRFFLQDKPIQKIVFSNIDSKDEEKKIIPQVVRNGLKYYLDFDFSKDLVDQSIRDGILKKLVVKARLDKPEILTMGGIKFFDLQEQQIPILTKEPQKALKSWGENIPFLAPFECISSFRPLSWIWENKREEIFHTFQFTQNAYKDLDVEISGENQWYHLNKDKQLINLDGIFTNQNSFVRLKINFLQDSVHLIFEGSKAKSIMIETLGDNLINLPLRFFLREGQLSLPGETEITLLFRPEENEQNLQHKRGSQKFEKWDLKIQTPGKDNFSKTIFPINKVKFNKRLWHSKDREIVGKLWPCFMKGNSLIGEITIERQGKNETLPLFLKQKSEFPPLAIATGSRLIEFKQKIDAYAKKESGDYELGFFDLKSENIKREFNFKHSEWWVKEAEINFISQDESVRIDEEKGIVYLFPKEGGKMRWTLKLPDVEFIAPLSLLLTGSIPSNVQLRLKIDDQKILLQKETTKIPFSADFSHLNTVTIEIESKGSEPFFKMNLPRLKVFGLRKTPQDEIKKLALTIGETKIPIPNSEFSNSNGEWVDLGRISLEQGTHSFHLGNTPFFRFKTLMLETNSILPRPGKKQALVVTQSIWDKLLSLGYKLILSFIVACILYIYRVKIKAGFQFFWYFIRSAFVKKYWLLPDMAWAIFWLLGSLGLYVLGLSFIGQRENYVTTFAGIFMVVFLWHLGRLMKEWFLKKIPKIAELIYQSRSTPFFVWGMMLLVITAVSVVMKLEVFAEQTIILFYYCLVVGVVSEIFFVKDEKMDR